MAKKDSDKKEKKEKKDKKGKKAENAAANPKKNGKRKKMLRSDYQKMQNQKINSMLGVPLDDQTGFIVPEEEEPTFFEKIKEKIAKKKKNKDQPKTLLDYTDKDKLMLIRGHETDIKDENKIKFCFPIVLLCEILSIIILSIYLLIIAKVATPTTSTDFLNIVFIIIAHFVSTAVLTGNNVSDNGLNFTMYKMGVAAIHWIGASVIMFVMHSMYSPSTGAAAFFQIALLIFAIGFYIIINLYRSEVMKTDVGYKQAPSRVEPPQKVVSEKDNDEELFEESEDEKIV